MPDWRPHPKQEEALKRIEYEILYGGSRGGGKTDAGLVWLTDYIDNPNYRALVIRKNADDLTDWIDRAVKFYTGLGATITGRPAVIKFKSGAIIRTGHLKDEQAYTKYQGHEYQRMLIEELTQIPDEKRYLMLLASCRSTDPNIQAQIFATTNPGGIGHLWVKERFIDVVAPNEVYTDPISHRTRIYIPATIDDNPTLINNDPNYINFLESLKSTDVELWKAWRLGDWNTFAGQFFKEYRYDMHIINPYLPDSKTSIIVGGLDWGYTAPFSFHLSSVNRVVLMDGRRFFRVKTFFEVYGVEKTPALWVDEIKEKLKFYNLTLDNIAWIQADPAIFNKQTDGSMSIRDQFIKADPIFYKIRKGSNDRIAGWAIMHQWLSKAIDGLPYWQITSNCLNLIKEIGSVVHQEDKVEDLEGEFDHALDANRYKLKALKWLDSKVGATYHQSLNYKPMPIVPQFIGNKQISVDLDMFAEPKMNSGSVGAVVRQ